MTGAMISEYQHHVNAILIINWLIGYVPGEFSDQFELKCVRAR